MNSSPLGKTYRGAKTVSDDNRPATSTDTTPGAGPVPVGPVTPTGLLTFRRDAHLFATRPRLVADVEDQREVVKLAPQQLLHPPVPSDYIVRRGKMRISQFLPNGREVSRAVLQAGAALVTICGDEADAKPAVDLYPLADVVLMALGEAELWALPAGSLHDVFEAEQIGGTET